MPKPKIREEMSVMRKWILPIVLFAALSWSFPVASIFAADQITLKLSHEMPTNHYGATWADLFAKKAEQESGGKIKIEVFPAGQLYKSVDGLQALSAGSSDMQMIIPNAVATIDESFNAIGLPYAFESGIDLANAFNENREIGKALTAKLRAKGIENIYWWPMTHWVLVNMKKPIKTADDLKGLKIRTLGGAPQQYGIEALGASTVQLSPTEVLTALAQGTIDGSPITYNYWRYQFTNAKYGTDAGGLYPATFAILVSGKRWAKLDPASQAAIRKAAEAVYHEAVKSGKSIDDADREEILKRGGELYKLPPNEIERWKKITQKAWQNPGLRQKIGEDIMKILESKK
jgi:TRAP-type C4-dicarboxylate transport system substrate-binding protein